MSTFTLPVPQDHIFDLPYYGGFASFTLRAFLVRHHGGADEDTFTCHAADDGRWLGYGDTKDDAVFAASCALAPLAEQAGVEAGRILRPYGPRVVR